MQFVMLDRLAFEPMSFDNCSSRKIFESVA